MFRVRTVETEHLTLRCLRPSDVDAYFALRSDPRVMRCIRGGRLYTKDEVKSAIANYESEWLRFGFGRWAVVRRLNQTLIGWVGLWPFAERGGVQLGCGLAPEVWNTGVLAEAVLATLWYGFEDSNLNEIFAITRLDNVAGLRSLEKLGLRAIGHDVFFGFAHRIYAIDRANFTLPPLFRYRVRDDE